MLFWPMVQGWENTPLRQIIADDHGLPTFVVGDSVRAAAITEKRFGHGQGLHSFVLVAVGWGIVPPCMWTGICTSAAMGWRASLGTPRWSKTARSAVVVTRVAWNSMPRPPPLSAAYVPNWSAASLPV